MAWYKTTKGAAVELGYSESAIASKIQRGDWLEGVHWIRAPDGRRMINIKAVYRWIEGAPPEEAAKAH